MDNFLVTEEGIRDLTDVKRRVDALAPFSQESPLTPDNASSFGPVRGYLMQPISRGGSGLCALVTRRPEYRSWKIDLAGIIFIGGSESRFQLRFTRDGVLWFDTDIFVVNDTPIQTLVSSIVNGSVVNGAPLISRQSIEGCLGNPTFATNLVINDDLYPELPAAYNIGDEIESRIGSWIFSIHNSIPDYDIDLLFTTDPDPAADPVTLEGPAVMTLEEIPDTPTGEYIVATDILNLPSPSPLQGGAFVVAIPFPDIGYGVIAAYPRDLFMEQTV